MLETIGVSSIEELFADLPAGVRLDRELDLPPALSEQELTAYFEALAAENAHVGAELSFLGAGIYDHYVPAIVDAVLQRGEFLTAYTPYQPELSQGVLQAIFEYQTAICELTGMDVSNASGYDGTTVAADACFIAKHATGRSKVVVTEATNPQVRQVVKTYAPGFGLEVVEVPHRDGATDPDELREAADDAACVIFQQPNFFGVLEPAPDLAAAPRTRPGRCRSPTSTRSRSACSRRPGATAARSRSAKGSRRGTTSPTAGRTTASSRRAPSSSGGCRDGSSARRLTPRGTAAMSSPCRRASSTSGARRRPRTSRPTRRCSRWPGSSTSRGSGRRGCARWGRPAWPSPSTRKSGSGSRLRSAEQTTFKEFAVRVGRPAREVVRAARERGVHPGYALGRDYAGLDDVLLVARHREADAGGDRPPGGGACAGVKLIYEKSQPGPPRGPPAAARAAGTRDPGRARRARAAAPARDRRAGPRCATSPSSRRATSASTPASTRSAPAR